MTEHVIKFIKGGLIVQRKNITTDKIKISNTGSGMQDALNLTEHIAGVLKLNKRNTFHARLLTEELFSMVRAITGEFNAEYWLEAENNTCILHLEAKADLDYSKKRELISASTKGENTAQRGIMERIRDIIEAGLYNIQEGFNIQAEYGTGMFNYGAIGITDSGMSEAIYSWSMQKYKDELQEHHEHEDPDSDSDSKSESQAWDELEKSIIANIADEVKVGINRDGIELTIYKTFR